MDDKLAASTGLPVVELFFESPTAEEFKDQVQGVFLRRMFDEGGRRLVSRVELRLSPDYPGAVEAQILGFMSKTEPLWRALGRSPRELADAIYQHLGGQRRA